MKSKRKGICLGLTVMLVLGILGGAALAQERPRNVVSFNPLHLIFGGITGEFERVINPGMSFYVYPELTFFLGAVGFGASVGIKKYFRATAPEGSWIGGFGYLAVIRYRGVSATGFGGGANVGHKHFITDRFTLEGRLGAYILMVRAVGEFALIPNGQLWLNLGYAF